MPEKREPQSSETSTVGGLILFSVLILVVGAATGLVAAAFRLCLETAERLREGLIHDAHRLGPAGFPVVVVAVAAAALVAAWMVRRLAPHAAGSGIPHVEAVLHATIPPAPFGLAPVKFMGGLLAIGSGLVLGREGPSVQMGAAVSVAVGRLTGRSWAECRELLAAGAGAGLATAFNAPIAGAVFVLEELVQRFEHRIAIAALGASAAAITISRMLIPNTPDFAVAPLAEPSTGSWPLFIALGCIAGLIAVAYNSTILAALRLADRAASLRVEYRAALVGAIVGGVSWFLPGLVGGGDAITQSVLAGTAALAVMPAVFLLRFVLGAASYSAGTPGGLFAPMLVLGTQIGFMFGAASGRLTGVEVPPEAFAVVGMAAFFAGVVRAPLTGIVLVSEMTASSAMLLPTVFASFAAMMVATLLRNPPVYDSLRERTIRLEQRIGKHPPQR